MTKNSVQITQPAPSKKDVSLVQGEVDQSTDTWLRAQAIVDSINANLPKGQKALKPIPAGYVFKKANREVVSVAMHAAFELCGGVPALAAWATENPEKFYGMWSRLTNDSTDSPVGGTTVVVSTMLPPTPHDSVTINDLGHVVSVESYPVNVLDDIPD